MNFVARIAQNECFVNEAVFRFLLIGLLIFGARVEINSPPLFADWTGYFRQEYRDKRSRPSPKV